MGDSRLEALGINIAIAADWLLSKLSTQPEPQNIRWPSITSSYE